MHPTLHSLLTLAEVALAAYAVGRPLTSRFRIAEDDWLAKLVWSLSLGLLGAGLIITGLGLFGGLYGPLISGLSVAGAVGGFAWAVYDVRCAQPAFESARLHLQQVAAPEDPIASPWLLRGLLCLFAAAAGGSFLSALAPPLDGDALCYHLQLPKQFLAQHGLFHAHFDENDTFPLLAEMWYLWALALGDPVVPQLIHWLTGLLLSGAAVLLAEMFVKRSWAWVAGAITLLVPGISNQMSSPLNDVAVALFTTLSLLAAMSALGLPATPECPDGNGAQRLSSRPIPRHAWSIIAGLMLGGAWSIKYTSLLFTAAAATALAIYLVRRREQLPQRLRSLAIATAIAACVAGVWYVRAAWHRGNPVYPFFAQHIGQAAPHNSLPKRKTPLGLNLADMASAPWQLTMKPQEFGGRGHQLGALFLISLPLFLLAWPAHRLGPIIILAGLYALLWYTLRQNLRFLYPLVPLASVAAACAWIQIRRLPSLPRGLAIGALVATACFQSLLPLVRARHALPVAAGWESRQSYLARREPTWPVAEFISRNLPPEARILSQELRAFYINNPVIREKLFYARGGYGSQLQPQALPQVLRQAGFEYLLLAEAQGGGLHYNARLSKLVDELARHDANAVEVLFDSTFGNEEATRRYRLVRLHAPVDPSNRKSL